jgi:16S rRNA (cytosine967-C5)-methyltransferase
MKKASYHVVNETVEYTKQEFGIYQSRFVNAILRRFVSNRDVFDLIRHSKHEIRDLAAFFSFPEWLIHRWINRFGRESAERLFDLLNKTPEFAIRVDTNKISRDEAAKILEEDGIRTRKGVYSDFAIYVDKLMPVLKCQIFKKGLVSIQDETSQLATLAINPKKGDLILDACAGRGTKTLHIKEIAPDANVISMDNSIKRLKSLGHGTLSILGDALQNPFKKEYFDKILIDAPCSSLGIIRKHPEIKWNRKEKDIIDYGNYQLELIDSLWDNLKTNGYIVYSVCSFEPEETHLVLESFKKRKMFALENTPPFLFNKEYFQSLPQETGMDGFFIAKLKKL